MKGILKFGLTVLSLLSFGHAGILNGSFENGLTGWIVVQGNVEVLQANNFVPSITPPHGNFFLLLSNGPGNSPAPDNTPYGDMDGDGQSDNDLTIVRQTFNHIWRKAMLYLVMANI